MGWRQDEIWLDTDPLWFRERWEAQREALRRNAPAFLGLTAVPQAVAVPNGLAASRQRRAELRRRKESRRTRAAALVIAPAAMLTLGGQRYGGGQADAALTVDPPSLTFRTGVAEPPAPEPEPTAPAKPARAERKAAVAVRFPKIRWNIATSHGLPFSGALTAGTQLPIEGRDWVTWNPVADVVPNEPHRLYGNEDTIRTIVAVLAAYRAAHPKAPRVVVGDISFRGGGPMEAHVSHQNGLDVDVYYPRLDRRQRAPRTRSQIDRRLSQDLLDRFVAAGAQIVFVGYATDLRGPKDVVVPYPNHEDHMHVRFPPRR
jgi:Penicillin-insensitive murein endopeptidase